MKPIPRTIETFLSTQEAADYLGISSKKLRQLTQSGEGPPHLYIGKTIKYPHTKLVRWIEEKIKEQA